MQRQHVCVDARKKIEMLSRLEQIVVDSNKSFDWENCLLIILSR